MHVHKSEGCVINHEADGNATFVASHSSEASLHAEFSDASYRSRQLCFDKHDDQAADHDLLYDGDIIAKRSETGRYDLLPESRALLVLRLNDFPGSKLDNLLEPEHVDV